MIISIKENKNNIINVKLVDTIYYKNTIIDIKSNKIYRFFVWVNNRKMITKKKDYINHFHILYFVLGMSQRVMKAFFLEANGQKMGL